MLKFAHIYLKKIKSDIFLKMGTSPKSSFFQRLARGLRPNDGAVQRGKQKGSTSGKQNGKQQRKMKSKTNIYFFNLFNCFKILSVSKSKEKNRIFFEIF